MEQGLHGPLSWDFLLIAQCSILPSFTHLRLPVAAQVRTFCAVALVSLLTYTKGPSGCPPALKAKLADAQEALGGLLGDSNELTQASDVLVLVLLRV